MSLDGGPNLDSREFLDFMKKWGIDRRLSSAYYPQSNGRAEAAVKTAKRITREHLGDNDKIARALLAYRNTPLKGCEASPAQLMLGRNIRDFVPAPSSGYRVSSKWAHFLRQREVAILKNNAKVVQQTEHRLSLGDLTVGTEVRCQNTRNNEWDRVGTIVECCGFRQYQVRMHGSGRIALRNRIHLRKILFAKPHVANMGNTKGATGSSLQNVTDNSSRYSQTTRRMLVSVATRPPREQWCREELLHQHQSILPPQRAPRRVRQQSSHQESGGQPGQDDRLTVMASRTINIGLSSMGGEMLDLSSCIYVSFLCL